MNKTRSEMEKKNCQLPGWLWPTSNALPPLYRRVWEIVKEERLNIGSIQRELLVDTNKVFPLLLTSQLPTEVLGYIWSLANQKYAGQLTEQELYIVLALIAIAQTSYAFTNLDVLHMLPGPPIPRLSLTNFYSNSNTLQLSTFESNVISDFNKHYDSKSNIFKGLDVYLPTTSNITSSYIGETRIDEKSLTSPVNKTTVDDRHNSMNQEIKFEARNTSPDFNDDFSDFQSAPIQSPPNIPLWDSKQGSAIGSRLANHNLSGGKKLIEKKKLSANKNNHGNNGICIISPLSSPVISKDRLTDVDENLFFKCNLKNEEKTTVILKDTAIRSEPLPQSSINSQEINVEKFVDIAPISKQLKTLATKVFESSTQDLMSLQPIEDKYSALRILIEEPVPLSEISSSLSVDPEPSDDFGEFVSAEKFESTTDSIQSTVNTSLDLFSDFEQFLPNTGNDKSEISFAQETIEAFAQLEITASPEKTINFLEEKYEVTIDPEKVIQKEDTVSINSIELNNGTEILTRHGSVPSLDLKLFLPTNIEDEKEKEIENMHQLIYSEWKQYMENCVLILRVSANIFMNITSDVVLQEVLNSAQGYNFLCNLAEVAAVCRRVNFSHKEMDINIMGFDDLLMDIDRIWADMEPFYTNIPIVTELPAWPLHSGEDITCALCLTMITSNKIIYNDNVYHLSCANLWLNCVNNNLPVLRYVSGHSHPIVTGNGNNSNQL